MNTTVHLTEDQIDDYLIGDLAQEDKAHLDNCGACQARVAEMEGPIHSFRNVSLAWSERHSATMPVMPINKQLKSANGARALWVAAAASAAVIAVALPLAHHGVVRTQDPVAINAPSDPAQTFSAEREEQIAQDNQMLQAIDREIGAPASSPFETFGLEGGNNRQSSTRAGSLQD